MKLSDRITGLTGGGPDGWDVFYRSCDMVANGEPVIELTIGEHDIGTSPKILAAMYDAATSGHTGYASVPGVTALRDAIARRTAERTGVPTARENVCITPGGQAALFAAHCAVCDPGDRALLIDPYYATYPGTIRAVGGVPVPVAARSRDGFQPQAGAIAEQAAGAVSLLINTPNNPTGAVYGLQTLEGVAGVSNDHDLWLLSDEVYDTQVWDGAHVSPRALPGMADRTLVIGSMSKSHAMTGSRIGWIIGPAETIGHMINLATNTTYGVPGYIQNAAVYALGCGSALEEEVAAPFRRRRALAMRLLSEQNILVPVSAQGAMYVMLDIRATGLTGEGFANRLLETAQVAVMPGESFGRASAGHIRVAMTVDDRRFKDALRRIIRFAEEIAP